MAPTDALARARSSAERALALDARLVDAHIALGLSRLHAWDWRGSEDALRAAVELDRLSAPAHHHHAWRLALTGAFAPALDAIGRARALDPLSLPIRVAHARILQFMRRPEAAVAELQRTVQSDPDFAGGHLSLGLALLQAGQQRGAVAALQRARDLSETPPTTALLAYALSAAGERDQAHALVADLLHRASYQYISPATLAGAYVGLGDVEQALAYYDRAYAERSPGLIYLRVEPLLDPLRGEPRFAALLQRLGF